MNCHKIIIVGTDTGVGKTVLSSLLAQFLVNQGKNIHYIKPFQTGIDHSNEEESDAYVVQNSGQMSSPATTLLRYSHPLAPLFASQDDQKIITDKELIYVKDYIQQEVQSKKFSHLIIEGAGGLYVPISKEKLFIDLLPSWRPFSLLIAARPSLGTINHTLLTIKALQEKKITPLGVVFLRAPQIEVSEKEIEENRWAIEHYGGVKVLGVIPTITDFKDQKIHFSFFNEIL